MYVCMPWQSWGLRGLGLGVDSDAQYLLGLV